MKSQSIVAFALLSLINTSCVRNVPATSTSSAEKVLNYQEDLSKVLPIYDFEEEGLTEATRAEKEKRPVSFTGETPKNDNIAIDQVIEDQANKNRNLTEMQGFRIYIYSGNSRSGFESAKSYILQNYPELEVYESYSQPTYKVKVGDFLSRMDAEKYYAALKGRFASPKIMMDRVNYKKGLQIKN